MKKPSIINCRNIKNIFCVLMFLMIPVIAAEGKGQDAQSQTDLPSSFLSCVEAALGVHTESNENEAGVLPKLSDGQKTFAPTEEVFILPERKGEAVPRNMAVGDFSAAEAESGKKQNRYPAKRGTYQEVGYQSMEFTPISKPVGANAGDFNPESSQWSSVGPFRVSETEMEFRVISRRSKILRTKSDLIRTAIVDPSICDVVQFTPREISIIGKTVGATHVTFWFKDSTEPVTFLVRTAPDPSLREIREKEFQLLEKNLAILFPNSKVKLTLVANKLLVTGQAKCVEEAADILRILRSDATSNSLGFANNSEAATVAHELDVDVSDVNNRLIIVDRLRVPGVQQVSLRVKLAELSRSSADGAGVDFRLNFNGDKIMLNSLLGALTGGGGLITYDCANVHVGLAYLKQNNIVRKLSEATLITASGKSANMTAGGEIPIPVSVGRSETVATDFRSYGTVVNFTPVVMDKDMIKLKINAEFSSLDGENGNEMNGVPGLRTKTVDTEVRMREGQTFALGTALDDTYQATSSSNIPVFSDLLGVKSKSRSEGEMVILVSPELVMPMEPDEVPPLPGFDVTEPTNAEFLLFGRLEGNPTLENRSTVWPRLRNRYLNGGSALISGPYGH
ncbi:MAG: pilus assembly protein N-terminal domain-containing protein [Planctomycetia bacterium]|nr:pilus assembly protein N-terminal domain-containing protein [Planctomycetia bacterium]